MGSYKGKRASCRFCSLLASADLKSFVGKDGRACGVNVASLIGGPSLSGFFESLPNSSPFAHGCWEPTGGGK